MSYNQPYRKPADDYSGSNDKYEDSQRIYRQESTAYRSQIRSGSPQRTSSSSSKPVLSSVNALSFLHSCGLDAEDLQTLAELPEHLIAADTLPGLLAQIQNKKASNTSSSRSSGLQASSSSRSWDDRSHAQLVEYPSDLPVHQSYSNPRGQLPTWVNVQQTSSPTCTYNSSDSNYVVEYNHLKEKESYFDKASYATEASRQKTSVVPQSFSSHSRDVSHSSLSSRDASQSSLRSSRDVSQSSYLSNRDVGLPSLLSIRDLAPPSHLASRNVAPPSHLASRNVAPPSHLASRNVAPPSHLASRNVAPPSHLASRNVAPPSHLASRNVAPPSHLASRNFAPPSHLASRNVAPPSHLASRDVAPPSHLASRDVAPPSHLVSRAVAPPSHLASRNVAPPSQLSVRDLAPPSHLVSRDVGQSSHQRRTQSASRVPTRKEASDFHGKTPPVFPYACVLCDITVLSNKVSSLFLLSQILHYQLFTRQLQAKYTWACHMR